MRLLKGLGIVKTNATKLLLLVRTVLKVKESNKEYDEKESKVYR